MPSSAWHTVDTGYTGWSVVMRKVRRDLFTSCVRSKLIYERGACLPGEEQEGLSTAREEILTSKKWVCVFPSPLCPGLLLRGSAKGLAPSSMEAGGIGMFPGP